MNCLSPNLNTKTFFFFRHFYNIITLYYIIIYIFSLMTKMSSGRPSPHLRQFAPVRYKKAPQAPRRFKSSYMFFSTTKHKEIRAELTAKGQGQKVRIRKQSSQNQVVNSYNMLLRFFLFFSTRLSLSLSLSLSHTHTHMHQHVHTYTYTYNCLFSSLYHN